MSPTPPPTTPTSTTAAARDGGDAVRKSNPKSDSGTSRPIAGARRCSMTGSKRRGIVLQDRDRHLLSEIAVMRIIDHEGARVIGNFGALRRASWRLLHLTRSGLLRQFFVGSSAHGRKAIYTLSPKGAELVKARFGGIQRPSGRGVVAATFLKNQTGIN